MSRIILYGELAEKFNPEYNLDVTSTKEALRALCVMVPGFKQSFSEGSYYLYVKDKEHLNIDEETLDLNISGTIHVIPEIIGAKQGGLGKVLLGIAMIGLLFVPGVNVAIGAALTSGFTVEASALGILAVNTYVNIGIALILGGATQLLSPKIKNSTDQSKNQSYLFNGASNTIENGSCVPLVYGEVLCGGYPISIEITNDETNYTTGDDTYNISIGGWNRTDYQVYQV